MPKMSFEILKSKRRTQSADVTTGSSARDRAPWFFPPIKLFCLSISFRGQWPNTRRLMVGTIIRIIRIAARPHELPIHLRQRNSTTLLIKALTTPSIPHIRIINILLSCISSILPCGYQKHRTLTASYVKYRILVSLIPASLRFSGSERSGIHSFGISCWHNPSSRVRLSALQWKLPFDI